MFTIKNRNRALFGLMTVLSVIMGIILPFTYLGVDLSELQPIFSEAFLKAPFFLYLHVFSAFIALIVGPFQFIPAIRNQYPTIHRWLGRIYLGVGIFLGGISGLVIAQNSAAGLVGQVGFSMLALAWLYTGWQAYSSIRHGKVDTHQRWMIRNYTLSFSAVTLRLWIPILLLILSPQLETTFAGDFDAMFLEAYRVVPFLAWIPNVFVAEWLIHRVVPQQQVQSVARRQLNLSEAKALS